MTETKTLTRDDLLKACAAPRPCERLEVPELGGALYVQALSGTQKDAFEAAVISARRQRQTVSNPRARLAAGSLVAEPGGARLFSDRDADVELLGQLPAVVLDRICAVAQRLAGFVAADLVTLAKVAEVAGHAD